MVATNISERCGRSDLRRAKIVLREMGQEENSEMDYDSLKCT